MSVQFTAHEFRICPDSLQAKDALCDTIDNYIRDRILLADQVIQETAGSKIKDGDVILTYARCVPARYTQRKIFTSIRRSSVVEKVLLHAWSSGKQFSVIVVDSRPMLEGTASVHLQGFKRSFTCAACPRQGIAAISYDCIDPVHISSLTISPVRLATYDDIVCRCALSPCERRRFFAGWNSNGCDDGSVTEYPRCGMLRNLQVCGGHSLGWGKQE